MATRWGICTAGKIANDFTACVASAPNTEHQVVAVAARNLTKAQEFAKHFSIPNAYGSYEELAKNPDVDVVYVGAVHPYHLELCQLYLNNGKNVLCEKPCTIRLQDTEKLVQLAKEKNLFFMEGFWTRFFPVYEEIRTQVEAGKIGEVRSVYARMNHNNAHVERIKEKELGGGGMLDLGCYPVMMSNMFFKGRPECIKAVGHIFPETGVDSSGSVILTYSNGRTATLEYHTGVADANNICSIMGSKGCIEVNNPFWCSTGMTICGEKKSFDLLPVNYELNYYNSNGFHYEANSVRKCLQQGLKENPVMPHQDTLDIMYIMEEALKQIGVTY